MEEEPIKHKNMAISFRRIIYRLRHDYLNVNNVVILVAFLIATSFIWGSLSAMQSNYSLQREVDVKKQQLEIARLETENLQLQQQYFKTAEYQELALRDRAGLAFPGEKQLVLPPNSETAQNADRQTTVSPGRTADVTNLEQWINFLFGGYSQNAGR